MCADQIVGYSIHVFAQFHLDIMEQIETGIICSNICPIVWEIFLCFVRILIFYLLQNDFRFFCRSQNRTAFISKVRVLMLSGAFTSSLRRAYDSGEDIRGAGIQNIRWKAPNMVGNSGWMDVYPIWQSTIINSIIHQNHTFGHLKKLATAQVAIGISLWLVCGLDAATRIDPDGILRTTIWHRLNILSTLAPSIQHGLACVKASLDNTNQEYNPMKSPMKLFPCSFFTCFSCNMWLFPSFFGSGDVWWCWVFASKNPKTMMLLHGQVWSPAFWWLLLCLCGFDAAARGLTGHVARFTAGICRPWLAWCCLTWWRCVRAGRNSQLCPWSNGWPMLLHTIHPWSPAPGHGGSMVRLSALCGMNRLETSTSWTLFSKGGWSQQTSSNTSWKRFFFWTVTSKTTDHLYEKFHPVIEYCFKFCAVQFVSSGFPLPGIFETFSPPFFALFSVASGFIASRRLSCRCLVDVRKEV